MRTTILAAAHHLQFGVVRRIAVVEDDGGRGRGLGRFGGRVGHAVHQEGLRGGLDVGQSGHVDQPVLLRHGSQGIQVGQRRELVGRVGAVGDQVDPVWSLCVEPAPLGRERDLALAVRSAGHPFMPDQFSVRLLEYHDIEVIDRHFGPFGRCAAQRLRCRGEIEDDVVALRPAVAREVVLLAAGGQQRQCRAAYDCMV